MGIKRILRKLIFHSSLKPLLERLARIESSLAARWVSRAYKRMMMVQWELPPTPEHFDHHIDLFYQWLATRNPLWVERGVFGSLSLKGGSVLELACGDGFNARNFYSLRSKRVVACDYDPKALETARTKNNAPNIEYVLADIRTQMPDGQFENIAWDAAIEHFSPDEIEAILNNIKSKLKSEGILSGYTIVESPDLENPFPHHKCKFSSKESLLRFLFPHFRNVTVFETIYPSVHNLYFWASDGAIPFSSNWQLWRCKVKDSGT